MNASQQLARSLSLIAEDLEGRGYEFAGAIRQAARIIAAGPDHPAGGCSGCGDTLPHGARKWCSERCRRRRRQ